MWVSYKSKVILKFLLLSWVVFTCGLFFSCGKNDITPGSYTITPATTDSSNWQQQYTYGGVLPNWDNNLTPNPVVGTKWVLTYFQLGFSFPPLPIDTIYFVNNQHYTINSGSVRTYQLTSNVSISSKTLTLNYHYPFGSGNYSGQVASSFVEDGVILNSQFVNTNTPTNTIVASFLRLQ